MREFGLVPTGPAARLLWIVLAVVHWTPAALAQGELSYQQYRTLAWSADRMDHVAMFEPLDGEAGMYLALAERFGTVQVVKLDAAGGRRLWKSIQLSGTPEELITADLNGDALEDALVCRTGAGKIYVWSMDGYSLLWESLTGEFTSITCFTTANVDDDPASEIVMLADRKLVYIDGTTFTKDMTSINDFSASMIRCGDVDADGSMEVVLNSGQVLDARNGNIEWEDQNFYTRIELLDVDGDGIPEVVTEDILGGPVKVFDVDYKSEVRFQ